MQLKQILGILLLILASAYGIYKISDSGVMDHLSEEWYSFLGFLLIALLLGTAIVRVLRA